jgi:hypothetical protein
MTTTSAPTTLDTAYLRRLGTDPVFFAREVWRHMGRDSFAPIETLEERIVLYLAQGKPFKVLLAFRGLGKTTFSQVIDVAWHAYRDPNRRFIIVSKSEPHAVKYLRGVKNIFARVPFLRHLLPRGTCRDGATQLDFGAAEPNTQPSITALGVGGQLEGNRAHHIVADDVETKRNSMTRESQAEVRHLCAEFPNILYKSADAGAPVDPCKITYLGTIKTPETIYGILTRPEVGFEGRGYPIVYPGPHEDVLCLAPELKADLAAGRAKPGDAMCPSRFPLTEVAKLRAANLIATDDDGDPIDFPMENMLIAKLTGEDRYPFKLRDFIVAPFKVDRDKAPLTIIWGTAKSGGESTRAPIPVDVAPSSEDCFLHPFYVDSDSFAPYTGTRARVDPAGGGKDKVGLSIAGHLSGFIWVKHVAGLEGGASAANMDTIAHSLRTHGATICLVEPNFGGDSFANLLQVHCNRLMLKPGADALYPNGWACSVELAETSSGQKELRMIGHLKPALDSHRVVLDPAVAADLDLQRQITRLTKARGSLPHDDKLETLAAVVHDWFEQLRLDPHASAESAKRRQLDDQLERDRRTLMPFLDKPRMKTWHEAG